MTTHTVTAMYSTRQDAETAAAAIRQDAAIGATNVQILPEQDDGTTTGTTDTASHESSFRASLRNFFMPEEDQYGYAEGMRRGSYLVAVDTDDAHADRVMNVLEEHGAIDIDAEERRWRSEGWRGYEPSSTATAGQWRDDWRDVYATSGRYKALRRRRDRNRCDRQHGDDGHYGTVGNHSAG